jgi:hypothetical protein
LVSAKIFVNNIYLDGFTLPPIPILHTIPPYRFVHLYFSFTLPNECCLSTSVPSLDYPTSCFPGDTARNPSSAAAKPKPSSCLPHPPQTREPTTSLRRPFAPLRPGSHNLEYSTSWCALRYEPHHLSSMTVEGQILYLVLAAFR